jgi:hypothetical protein
LLFKTVVFVAVFLSAVFVLAQDAPAPTHHAFAFTDDNVSWMYGNHFREPYVGHGPTNNIANNIDKNGIEYQHIDGGNRLGDNFLDITLLIANHQNPVSVGYYHDNAGNGSMDFYTIFRHDIVLSRAFNFKKLSWGPIDDVALSFGSDIAAKNDDFSNERKSPMVGPSVLLKAPNHGVLKISAMWTKEWNEEGTDITSWGMDGQPKTWGKTVVYDQTYTLQAVWNIPFLVAGRVPFKFHGFATFNGSKGHNAGTLPAPGAQILYQGTKPETLINPELAYNFGRHFGEPHKWEIGAGYQWWNNKFGVDHKKAIGCLAHTPFIRIAVHF